MLAARLANQSHNRLRLKIYFFCESAWAEVKRLKEPEIIHGAYKRAKRLLGTEARSVTDHLPVPVSSRELA